MTNSEHSRQSRLSAFLLAVLCFFSFVFRDIPVSASTPTLPENVYLEFADEDEQVTVSEDGTDAVYDIPVTELSREVNMRLRFSLNKHYREGQLRIVIPFNGFYSRDGSSGFTLSNKAALLNQIQAANSSLKVLEDRTNREGDEAVLILTNKKCDALQDVLELSYKVVSRTVEDEAEHGISVTVTDEDSGDDISPDEAHATFKTKVTNVTTSKRLDEFGLDAGCYTRWDDSLERKYKLTSKYGIDNEAFKELAKQYNYISYYIVYSVTANQTYDLYFNDTPHNDGEVVAVSKMYTARDCTALDKVESGEHAGEWQVTGTDYGRLLVRVRYPKI